MRYLPLTDSDRQAMLARIGVAAINDLFVDVPTDKMLRELPALPRRPAASLLRSRACPDRLLQPIRASITHPCLKQAREDRDRVVDRGRRASPGVVDFVRLLQA